MCIRDRNKHGIFDLSGNAQEWVSTPLYGPDEEAGVKAEPGVLPRLGVLRGGGWDSFREEDLYTGTRSIIQPGRADKSFGFRVVLARIPLDAPANPLDSPTPQQEPDSPPN